MAPSKASLPSSREPSFSAFADKKHLSFSNVLKENYILSSNQVSSKDQIQTWRTGQIK